MQIYVKQSHMLSSTNPFLTSFASPRVTQGCKLTFVKNKPSKQQFLKISISLSKDVNLTFS